MVILKRIIIVFILVFAVLGVYNMGIIATGKICGSLRKIRKL